MSAWSLDEALERFVADGFNDGDLISHDWLTWALNLPQPRNLGEVRDVQFVNMHRIEEFKSALLEQMNIYIVSVRGQGYRIVPPHDQARVAVSKALQSARRELDTCQKVIGHTRLGELSAEELRRHTDTQIRCAALGSMIGKGGRDIFALFEPPKQLASH